MQLDTVAEIEKTLESHMSVRVRVAVKTKKAITIFDRR